MLTTAIGPFRFVSLAPVPQPARQHLAVESQAGKPGVAIWQTGSRGVECTCETLVDAESWLIGQAVLRRYATLCGATPVPVIVGNANLGRYQVLEVHGTVEPIVLGTGGVCGRSAAIVKANWKLIAV